LEENEELFKKKGMKFSFQEGKKMVSAQLGKGEFGGVFVGWDVEKEEYVAVKVIKGVGKIEESKDHLQIELMEHFKNLPGILPILDYQKMQYWEKEQGQCDGLYIFMPLAGFGSGNIFQQCLGNLDDIVLKRKILGYVAKSLLIALTSLHDTSINDSNIYHLDIKPDNLLLDKDGNVFLSDFGCAVKAPKPFISRDNNGTTAYFSPQRYANYRRQAHESGKFDLHTSNVKEMVEYYDARKEDIWMVGVTLLQFLLNKYPFDRGSFAENFGRCDTSYFRAKLKGIFSDANLIKCCPEYLELLKNLLEVEEKDRPTAQKVLRLFQDKIFNNPTYCFASEQERREAFVTLKELERNVLRMSKEGSKKDWETEYVKPRAQTIGKQIAPVYVEPRNKRQTDSVKEGVAFTTFKSSGKSDYANTPPPERKNDSMIDVDCKRRG
jgi:serine/threonine protein kinase